MILMVAIKTELTLNEKSDENGTDKSDGQSDDIDDGVEAVSEEIPNCYFNEIAQHDALLSPVIYS
jgi:hypothetical protein